MTIRNAGWLLGSSLAALIGAMPALAQDTPAEGSEEVTVTAQKTKQSLQKVPLAVSALGAQAIEDSRIRTVTDLQEQTPGLRINALQGGTQVGSPGTELEFAL